ncbi:MAG: polyphosphate kinase 1 [Phycisphaerales bacterium]|jgi:polyphosphate kinase|nr:polyphosphate kinase 1 [Phycisphaerales bacterium]
MTRIDQGAPSRNAQEVEQAPRNHTQAAPIGGAERYFNRDLSWLEFNRRVLAQAQDARNPLLERVKFLAIFASNLDEFFMKRVGLMRRELALGEGTSGYDGWTTRTLLARIREVVQPVLGQQASCWHDDLLPGLERVGVSVVTYASLGDEERRAIDAWFVANVFPVLTPLAVDPGHRFPFISNLSENIGVILTSPGDPDARFARVKIPDTLPRWVRVDDVVRAGPSGDDGVRLLPLDALIQANLHELFPGMTIRETLLFRVTRNAAVERAEEEVEDLLEHVEAELRMRRFASPVRLEIREGGSGQALDFVMEELGLAADDVYERRGPLEYGDLFQLLDLAPPRAGSEKLRFPTWRPAPPPALADEDASIFARIRERDILLHHPYESFEDSVERFIAQAARDPEVLAIKQTIYRTSPDSPFVASLVRAAESGKQVACLVELRARFDEQRNVHFARRLEEAGVHVAYGVMGLKTHCKCSLVVRREGQGLRSYAHLGTGNYHPRTAQLYTDLGLLTCDPAITGDVADLFNVLTGHSRHDTYRELVVAPHSMRDRFEALIREEIDAAKAGRPARIIAKMNAMEDQRITDLLYEASNAGVPITLFVRGFCCLRPGMRGMSENIRVVSILGRFLEHSRFFHFARGESDPARGLWLVGSADWMYRNLNTRVEAAFPIRDEHARRRLVRIVEIMEEDQLRAWDMRPDGTYVRREPPEDADPMSPAAIGTFATLMREANPAFTPV